jgi:hypothetical protein
LRASSASEAAPIRAKRSPCRQSASFSVNGSTVVTCPLA